MFDVSIFIVSFMHYCIQKLVLVFPFFKNNGSFIKVTIVVIEAMIVRWGGTATTH